MPPRINIHKRIEEDGNKKLKTMSNETFEELDKVYIKSLQWYASKGWGDYHNQEKFWGIQADKDKQFIFITYLEPHEQISRNPSGQTYDEYINELSFDRGGLMYKETFEEKYPKPDVVIYQNLNDKKKVPKIGEIEVPEIGEFIYTTSSNITKHKKVTEIIQEQEKANQREELNKALQGDISF